MKFLKFSDMKLEEKLERTPLIFFYIISSSRDIVLKEVQNGTKSGSTYCQNFSETLAKKGDICDFTRFRSVGKL